MGGAITYALNNERYLRAFLLDGDLELSNNRGERVIKPFVIGRKNWLFSDTKNGAQVSSIYYSIVETAKLNNLDIQGYLEYVLDELVDIPKNQRNQELSRLMPYSNNLPDHLYSKSK